MQKLQHQQSLENRHHALQLNGNNPQQRLRLEYSTISDTMYTNPLIQTMPQIDQINLVHPTLIPKFQPIQRNL